MPLKPRGPGAGWHASAVTDGRRDLTDSAQNHAVLTTADALGADPAVLPEAGAIARARARLAAAGPVHLSVVWAMYGETGRMSRPDEHPHGEDFVREKVRQLDWLTAGLPGVTWSILACDDGCPDRPSSAAMMRAIVAAEGYPAAGHRAVEVLELADVLSGAVAVRTPLGAEFHRLASPDDSRKGGSILAALAAALDRPVTGRHVVCYTDADLSANLAQLGSLAAPLLSSDGAVAVAGQRYGMDGAVLVKADGPSVEPASTGDKPDKLIILFRHFVRALLIPDLAHILDTQAGFKAFDAAALRPVLAEIASFDETFDVELLIRLTQRYGARAVAAEPIVFTEDFAATNFPSVDPGERHLAMVRQIVGLYSRLVAPVAPATGEAAELLELLAGLDVAGYAALIARLRELDAGDSTLFERRWPVSLLQRTSLPR